MSVKFVCPCVILPFLDTCNQTQLSELSHCLQRVKTEITFSLNFEPQIYAALGRMKIAGYVNHTFSQFRSGF